MASWTMGMLAHPAEASEFRFALNAIQPIMTDSEVSRDAKRKTLSMLADELSEKTFKLKPVARMIMTIINMKEEVCREYADSESQMEGILGWLPRFKEHRDMLLQEVKHHRKNYRLKT